MDFPKFLNSLTPPNLMIDDLQYGETYYMVSVYLNRKIVVWEGKLCSIDDGIAIFERGDLEYSMIKVCDYYLTIEGTRSINRVFDCVEEANAYRDHLRDVLKNKKIIQG